MRWLLLLALVGCSKGDREEKLAPDHKTYSSVTHEGTTAAPQLYMQASALMDKNDPVAARPLYQKAIDLEPHKPMGYVGMASTYLRERKLDEARKFYQWAADVNPKSSSARVGLGSVASLQGNEKEAAAQYERALAIDENYADAHWGAALSYEALGDHEKKRAHARRFIILAPGSMLLKQAAEMALR